MYSQRGVTLCANTVKYDLVWIKKLLKQMHKLGLNQLTFECKIKLPGKPEQNTWPYYTGAEISELCAYAVERGIDVIPLINAPAHMETWLMRAPEFAITNKEGKVDVERLNFISDEGVNFYCSLIDEYLTYFDSPYWHMGADEFDHRVYYSDYPQIEAYAKQRFGSEAVAEDAFIEFVNKVNAYVKSRGKKLRVWNDGLRRSEVIQIDRDITVDYWLNQGLTPQEVIDAGFAVVNVPQYLYLSRSVEFYGFRGEQIYNSSNWQLRNFDAGPAGAQQELWAVLEDTETDYSHLQISPLGVPVTHEETEEFPDRKPLLGLRCAIWPDLASMQTDREALEEAREMLGYMGHILAGGEREWKTWEQAQEALLAGTEDISLAAWCAEETFTAGIYEIPALTAAMNVSGPWRIEKTRDGYYTLTDLESGRQLALRTGEQWLSIVNEIGAKAEMADPVTPVLPREKTAGEFNMRKFAIEFVDQHSIRISPALTHMLLTATATGLVQLPPDIAGENSGENSGETAVFSVSRLENQ